MSYLEDFGAEHSDELHEEVGLRSEEVRHNLLEAVLEGVGGVRGHGVPSLGLAPVAVVDGVEHVVLHVPAEGGEEHAHIHPRDHNPGDVHVRADGVRALLHGAPHVPQERGVVAPAERDVVQVPA
eukprot:794779-Prorocentrum_minimum.AAC.4